MEDDKGHEELRVLYSACVSEITEFKQQQWRVTNYGFLLYAVIISIASLVKNASSLEFWLLVIAASLILGAGWYVLGLLAQSILVRRKRLTETRSQFTPEFMNAWRYGRTEKEMSDFA